MQTTPLAKAITTLEGQLAVVCSAALAAGSAVGPHTLPPKWAGILATVMNVALIVQRGVLKAQASKALTAVIDSTDVQTTIADLAGTPAEEVQYGLAPGDVS